MTSFAPFRTRLTRAADAGLATLSAAAPGLRGALGLTGLAAILVLHLRGVHGPVLPATLLLWLLLELGFMPGTDGAFALVAVVAVSALWPVRSQLLGASIANDVLFLLVGGLIVGAVARLRATRATRDDALARLQAALAARDTALAEAQAALARADAALQVRDAFLAAANHDLRTPLTAIVGYSALLEQRLARDDAPLAWIAQTVRPLAAGARRMARIVDDIADATAVQTEHPLALRRATVDLGALVAGVAATMPEASGAGRLRLALPAAPLCVGADQPRVERVLHNVIDNALTYSEAGVAIAVWAEGAWACVAVTDQGQGIAPDELPQVFTRYYRGRGAPTHAGGTGIGLATARAIVERHGGTIEIASARGAGTTVTVRLPWDADDQREAARAGGGPA